MVKGCSQKGAKTIICLPSGKAFALFACLFVLLAPLEGRTQQFHRQINQTWLKAYISID